MAIKYKTEQQPQPYADHGQIYFDSNDGNKVKFMTPDGTVYDTGLLTSGNQIIEGVKTFNHFPIGPSSEPTSDYEFVNRKFVLDNISSGGVTGVIKVATSGGNFTSITDALASITDNDSTHRYVIQVFPGVYSEPDSVVCKPYVDILGVGGVFETRVTTQQSSHSVFVLSTYMAVKGISAYGSTGASAYELSTPGLANIDDCMVLDCKYGITVSNQNATIYANHIGVLTYSSTIEKFCNITAGNLVVSIPRIILTASIDTAFYVSGTSATLTVQTGVFDSPNLVNAFYCDNGGYLRIDSCMFKSATNVFRIGLNGINSTIQAYNCVVEDSSAYDVYLESSTAIFHAFNCDINRDKMSIAPGAVSNTVGRDRSFQTYRTMMTTAVGNDFIGAKFESGEGGPYKHNMRILEYNSSSYNDVTNSTDIAFPNTSVDTCIYIGNSSPKKFYGLGLVMGDTQLDLGSGAIVSEYYDAGTSSWVEVNSMATKTSSSISYLGNPFQNANAGDEITMRFDQDMKTGIIESNSSATGWATTTINSINAYWIRYRITSPINTSMKLKNFTLKGNYSEIRANGTKSSHGEARGYKLSALPLGDGRGGTSDSTFYVSNNIDWYGRENKFVNGATDTTPLKFIIPDNLDTSCGLTLMMDWKADNSGEATAKMHLYYSILSLSTAETTEINYDGANPEEEIAFELHTNVGDSSDRAYRKTLPRIDLSKYQPGDVVYMLLKRRNNESGDDMSSITITGYWTKYRAWQDGYSE